MSRSFLRLAATTALMFLGAAGQAFSLIGPATAWQTPRLGYTSLFGPRNINEDYRYNVPVLYYACTPDFLAYFGSRGAKAIDEAMAMYNAVPAASQTTSVGLDATPLEGFRMNYRAQELQLLDLKTYTVISMTRAVGLGSSPLYVYTLRSRWLDTATPPNTNFWVIRRNFDPVTWEPTPYINGQLWTYDTILDGDTISITDTVPVDPLFGYLNLPVSTGSLGFGRFVVSFTRDDIGGLRFIYRPDNYNVETAVPSASGGAGSSPWGVPGGTNAAGTNAVGFVNTALRPGVDKLTFQKLTYDSLLGFYVPVTNLWQDKFVTNYRVASQYLQRPLGAPDILFDVGDLVGGDGGNTNAAALHTFVAWQDNDALNGSTGTGLLGPGQITTATAAANSSGYTLIFNIVGQIYWNIAPTFLSEADASIGFLWGSFDGSTNEPVVYPNGLSLREVENAVLNSSSYGGTPWAVPGGGGNTNAPAGGGGSGTGG